MTLAPDIEELDFETPEIEVAEQPLPTGKEIALAVQDTFAMIQEQAVPKPQPTIERSIGDLANAILAGFNTMPSLLVALQDAIDGLMEQLATATDLPQGELARYAMREQRRREMHMDRDHYRDYMGREHYCYCSPSRVQMFGVAEPLEVVYHRWEPEFVTGK